MSETEKSQGMVRIASASAAWGDTIHAVRQLMAVEGLDYLVGDYLAEVTMAILARKKAASEAGGYIPDWLASVKPVLGEIRARGVKLITNSGGMNPLAAREAFEAMAEAQGLEFKVAVVTGDDLLPREGEIRAEGQHEMFTGAEMPARFASINAYLGAAGIARALDAGADVVITGRVVDSALVLGPLMHEFGWSADDWDKLAQGSLAGHVIECGAQATGGLFTDWQEVAEGWADMGYPVIDCAADGSFEVTKPPATGGLVTPATVGEQIVYEIGDPGAYLLPDVTCDFREVQLEQVGPDRVRVSGARGRAPGPDYKLCGTWMDGYRLITTYMIAGGDAAARGRRMAEALIERTARLIAEQGLAPYRETLVEVIGAGDCYGPAHVDPKAREAVVKIGLRHDDKRALEIFAREFAMPGVSMAQGLTGVFSGRPAPAPVVRVFSLLWPKARTPVQVDVEGQGFAIDVPDLAPARPPAPLPPLNEDPAAEGDPQVPLCALAWARSGDKGTDANIGVIARRPEFLPRIAAEVTEARVGAWFAHYLEGKVTRFDWPGLNALNFVLSDCLNGGGSASLRYDPQAKTFGQILLDMPVAVPREWLAPGGALHIKPARA
ncbi:acyclic terpene utilization AtuA family protein [Marimonas lutisalis]|uniref:acyclic terpene utilization AtuA family protein n=1 Tax=Marimonas lutisalis TaxID=2545756 RepID=UPI001F2D2709|nr:acyclic terpene utilization AtuA family protein [Marimonas lutisalis]